ncbi:MAG TPA: tryptophan--tRNA ligase [Candidatus Babeliales bacterium]|nr:tryptophan--tRNA ligase [Candidatus Babeliales bacterium]
MAHESIVLTGDRPTGPLHLGHYLGSLKTRIEMQEIYKQFVMIADTQALTDYFDRPEMVRKNVLEVCLDYLAVGIDPQKSTLFIQSLIPEIAELTVYFLNLVSVNRLMRNPTVKSEIIQKEFGERLSAGFLTYPVSQAADIVIVKGTIVPVGEDQLPHIEQTNEIIHTFNRTYNKEVFGHVTAHTSKISRLPGIDGKTKMSKSLNNAIFLSDSADIIAEKVMKMYTDPDHIHVNDPGKVEGNVVFSYLDIFDTETDVLAELKAHYCRGGLGDVALKKRLINILNTLLEPIRKRRAYYAQDTQEVMNYALIGSEKVRHIAAQTMNEVRGVMCLDYK